MSASRFHLDTAVPALAAFQRVYAADEYSFLCESLGEAGRNRYSFFGGRPRLIHRTTPHGITVEDPATGVVSTDPDDLIESLRRVLAAIEPIADLPPFSSGLVGYFGYDIVRRFERLRSPPPDPLGLPDSVLMVPGEIVIVDHRLGTTDIVVEASPTSATRLAQIWNQIAHASASEDQVHSVAGSIRLEARTSRLDFEAGVRRILEHIRAGDVFQGVLSQRFEAAKDGDPLDLYRALRVTNPAPYMYFLKLGSGHAVLGSSPEILVSLEEGRALTRPLAGTRPRGISEVEDHRNAAELLADEKERAEHVMLVDLARNDLGRVCEYGSVAVTRQFEIERHARVMHIVSEVTGVLREEHDALDLLRATFPAGTVSGTPKIRAMEIIDSLEPVRRGLYGGAIGYIDPAGRMDLCLAIRTLVVNKGRVLLQAGAGIVADSDPSREYEETLHKAEALVRALEACAGTRGSGERDR